MLLISFLGDDDLVRLVGKVDHVAVYFQRRRGQIDGNGAWVFKAGLDEWNVLFLEFQ